MFWSEEDDTPSQPTSDIVDVVFVIEGKTLPNNTLSAIAICLSEQVEGWNALNQLGLHLKLGGEEGNGWFRDSDPNAVLYLSRRTKLLLRVAKDDLAKVEAIAGQSLDVSGHPIKLRHKHNKPLLPSATLYSHHVISEFTQELDFLQSVQSQLTKYGISCKKILSGKSRQLTFADLQLTTRSLMLNDLSKEDSILLQAKGLGNEQKRGCGVFVPYKSIG